MSACALLEELRALGVVLEAEDGLLHVDAPAGALTEKLKATLVEYKQGLVKLLEWERRQLEEADQRGLIIKRARERGWIAIHDPTTGEWHEVKASECLPRIVETANTHRKKGDAA
jgi:hypothetical protein